MTDDKRLIETAFPLAEASAASLHEKNMRHGHISTLHLWPARRPLAASRAAIAAALISDPGNDEERSKIVTKLGGKLVPRTKGRVEYGRAVEIDKVEASGGILWWGKESTPDADWFREEIFKTAGGRAPRVLDPFSGGGAIPLEAMRLGCEVVANELNPVAWFLLRCTLEYPQRLAGQTHPLPEFARKDRVFAERFLKAEGYKGANLRDAVDRMTQGASAQPSFIKDNPECLPWERASFAWHLRAWGLWVIKESRNALEKRYPMYAYWEPLQADVSVDERPPVVVTPDYAATGAPSLNAEFNSAYLADSRNPRWIVKPTVAYLWARTVSCKSCRATIPLLRTRWLCKRDHKRAVLNMEPNTEKTGVVFSVQSDVPQSIGTAGQKKEADRLLGIGTMSRTGVRCPCCNDLMTMNDLQYESKAGRFGCVLTAVVVDGRRWKEYRDPTDLEKVVASVTDADLEVCFKDIPFGIPKEPLSTKRPSPNTRGVSAPTRYGLDRWDKLFSSRQLLAMGTFVKSVRSVHGAMPAHDYPEVWREAMWAYLSLAVDRLADYGSSLSTWICRLEAIRGTFGRFALAMVWDFCETNPFSGTTGDYLGAVEWISKVVEHTTLATQYAPAARIDLRSATQITGEFDAIITDPPYYDAIPYSDCMDFFHVWLRRSVRGLSKEVDEAFANPLGPKWDHDAGDGELIDDVSRFDGNGEASRANFEAGMAKVLKRCAESLRPDGRLVLVFANKSPTAWGTLVSALVKSGFVVEGSLPIQTERAVRSNAIASASLSSSVWLVCRKRPAGAQPGWSARVIDEMRANIGVQMRRFWDAGIRGPDFVWAATGPSLEVFSRHPVVFREATASGQREVMSVLDFLDHVRRLVVEFAVGRVLNSDAVSGVLDEVTTYYLLHRHTFGMDDAPIGACILYAISCGLTDAELAHQHEIFVASGGVVAAQEDDVEDDESEEADEPEATTGGSGNKVKLRRWDQRKRKSLGLEGIAGRPVAIIDRIHRLIRLWKEGDVAKVDAFLDQAGLSRDQLFAQVIQAIVELARRDGKPDEASLLESISNHLQSRAGVTVARQINML